MLDIIFAREVGTMLNLTVLRRNKNWTLRELSERAHISLSDLSKIERGTCPAWPNWRRRIANAFELENPEILFQEVKIPNALGGNDISGKISSEFNA
jgi:transcriptional regulator with XRE-family HTH domain